MSLALAAAVPSDTSAEQRERDQRFVLALEVLLSNSDAKHTASDLVTLAEGPSGLIHGSVTQRLLRAGVPRGTVDLVVRTLAAARDFAPVIIDTAGRMQTRSGLMDELAKIRRVVTKVAPTRTVEVLLVLDGTAGQNGLAQARGFDTSAGIDGIVLTKLDSGARGGVALAVRRELGLPIRWVGTGERATDLVPFSAEAYVDGLLGAPTGS
jgi:fused signal recognition particle receptor